MRVFSRVFLAALLLASLLCASSCGGSGQSAYGEVVLRDSPVLPEGLAVYVPVPVSGRAQVPPYPLPADLSGVAGLDRRSLTSQVLSGLRENGFAVAQGEWDFVYEPYLAAPGAKFVTVDAVFQAFLGMCAGIRLELERGALRRELESLVSGMLEVLRGMFEASRGSVREAAGKALGFLGVAAGLLGLDVDLPPETAPSVEEESGFVEEAAEVRVSPLFGRLEDYRAYRPPGYYARDPGLAGFYRAVTWLGRWAVFPSGGEEPVSPQARREGARSAALLVGALHMGRAGEEPLLVVWDRVYQVTRYLSGNTAGPGLASAERAVRESLGERFPLSRLEDDALADRLAERLEEEAGRKGGETGGIFWKTSGPAFRLLEAFADPAGSLFRELAPGDLPGRERPRGLDLPAVLGSDRALKLLEGFYREGSLPGFAEKVRALRREAAFPDPARARSSLFWSVLRNALGLLRSPGEGYPSFMRGDAWKDRDLYLFLSLWVDGLSRGLFWREVEAEVGPGAGERGGGASTAERGYVEPRPEAFALMAADADCLRRGLGERGLLSESAAEKLEAFYRLATDLKRMAEKELLGQALSPEEHRVFAGLGEALLRLMAVPGGEEGKLLVPEPCVLAEVYRDREEGTALAMALGKPAVYYVIAPVEGRPTLTLGAGYAFYELAGTGDTPFEQEEWRYAADSCGLPEPPAWTASFLR